MNVQDLLDNGYKECTVRKDLHADKAFQKKFFDGNSKKKFFLSVYFYDFEKFGFPASCLSFSAEARFYEKQDDRHWWTIMLHGIEKMSISDMENRFEKIYSQMSFIPDIHNND